MTRFAALLILPLIAAPASARACGMVLPPEKPATVVVFTRVGGVAGLNDRVTVRTDASATVEHGFLFPRHPRVDVVLTDTDRRALLSDLDGAGFTRLAERSGTPPFPDAFEYTITYQGHTVRRSDADRLGELAPAIHRLTGLLQAR